MFSGVKFIPRDQVEREQDENGDESRKDSKKSGRRKEKDRRRKKSSRYSSSDDDIEKIKKGSRKKKKWYASDEDLSSDTDESKNESESDYEEKRYRKSKGKKEKRTHEDSSEDEVRVRSKKKAMSRREVVSSKGSDDSASDDYSGKRTHHKGGKRRQNKDKTREGKNEDLENELQDDEGAQSYSSLARKEMGLDWMLRPKDTTEKTPMTASDNQLEEAPAEEVKKVNPRELNPYLKDNGSGYPEESEGTRTGGSQLMSSTLVGDGGASWRLKAFRRAQEQAAREGRELEEVVEERWGSLSQLAVSVATRKAAPTRAHLHAIKNRRKGLGEEEQTPAENDSEKVESLRHPRMKVPKLQDSLSWGKRNRKVSTEDAGLVSAAISGINKFKDDGSFMNGFMQQKNDDSNHHANSSYTKSDRKLESSLTPIEHKETSEDVPVGKAPLSSNQLAAKVMQLRMKGKHEEAEKLLKEAETLKVKQGADDEIRGPQIDGSTSRYVMHDISLQQKKKEDDADLHLAQRIMRNHKYSISGQADEEYDYDEGPRRKSRKKGGGNDGKPTERTNLGKHITIQQERCQFCFENPNRQKHLVIAIANFAYLSLPNWEPVVPAHCCVLTMQHESATRSVDDNVWNEIRNFKKCLIMMFGKQEKDVVFLETVMGLAQQRRHCLVECIPLPREIAKQAPVYFKKAIDEAEDEWSQHNAKKLIDTSQKGLRGSIPKNFPYFYVEFGLDKGFVHVIDDEKEFKSSFGLNVIRGMLRLPAEDMNRRRKHESVDKQKQAVANFARDWEPFDWTKQLDS